MTITNEEAETKILHRTRIAEELAHCTPMFWVAHFAGSEIEQHGIILTPKMVEIVIKALCPED